MVNSHNINGDCILRWGRDNGLLGTTLEMESSLLLRSEGTTALTDVISTSSSPRNLGCILLLEDLNLVAVDLNASLDLLDLALESTYSNL